MHRSSEEGAVACSHHRPDIENKWVHPSCHAVSKTELRGAKVSCRSKGTRDAICTITPTTKAVTQIPVPPGCLRARVCVSKYKQVVELLRETGHSYKN